MSDNHPPIVRSSVDINNRSTTKNRPLRPRLAAAAGLPLMLVTFGVSAADLKGILDRNHTAHGGDAYARIDAIRVELLIEAPTTQVRGTYLAAREGLARIDLYAGQHRIFAEGVSQACAWSWNPRQPAAERGGCVEDTETNTLRHGLELPGLFYTLRDVRNRGTHIQLMGAVGSDSGPEWQLRLTLEDGFTQDYFIDQVSYLVTRTRDFRVMEPADGAQEVLIETRFEDPSWVEGVLRFGRQVNVNVNTGEVMGTTRVLDLAFNPEISAELFEPGRAVSEPQNR